MTKLNSFFAGWLCACLVFITATAFLTHAPLWVLCSMKPDRVASTKCD